MLKSISLFSVFLLFSYTTVHAQDLVGQKPERNIPVIVSVAFSEKFPAMDPVWFTNYQGRYNDKLVYEGRFMFEKRYATAVYNRNGILLAFITKMDQKELPQKAQDYMQKNFPSFQILDAVKVERQNNAVSYEAGILVDNTYVVKVFSETGDFVKSTF